MQQIKEFFASVWEIVSPILYGAACIAALAGMIFLAKIFEPWFHV